MKKIVSKVEEAFVVLATERGMGFHTPLAAVLASHLSKDDAPVRLPTRNKNRAMIRSIVSGTLRPLPTPVLSARVG
jgi:hypothetical protein